MGSTRLCGLNKPPVIGTSNIGIPIESGWMSGEGRLSLEPPLMDHMLFLKRANKHFLFRLSNTWQRNTAVIIYPSSCSFLPFYVLLPHPQLYVKAASVGSEINVMNE